MKKNIIILLAVITYISLESNTFSMSPEAQAAYIIHQQKERINVPGFVPQTPVLTPTEKRLDDLKFKFIIGESLKPEEIAQIKKAERGSLGGLLLLKKCIGAQTLTSQEEAEMKEWQETIDAKYRQ